jgi:hypothetical protein
MTALRFRIAALTAAGCFALAAAAPAFALEAGQSASGSFLFTPASERNIIPVVLWTLAGIAIGCLVFATFYLLKRRVGGFPRNPSWIPPIELMHSKDLADENTWPESSSAPSDHTQQHAH